MKRFFSFFLAVLLLAGCLPVSALAVEPTEPPAPAAEPEETPVPSEKPQETPAPSEEPEETPAPGKEPVETPAPSEKPQETPVPSEKPQDEDTAVAAVQALADALPVEITPDEMDAVGAQLNAFIAACGALSAQQQAQVDMSRYEACMEAMYELQGMAGAQNPAPAADFLWIFDRGANQNVSDIVLYATNDNGVRQSLTNGCNAAALGFSRGKSYPLSIDADSAYLLISETMTVPKNSSIGDQAFNVIVTKKTTLTVTVKDSLGNLLPGIKVRLSGSSITSTTTDDTGTAVFRNLRGIYQVVANVDYTKADGSSATVSSHNIHMKNEDRSVTLTIPSETFFTVRAAGKGGGAVVDPDISSAAVTVTNADGRSTTLSRRSDGSYAGNVSRSRNGEESFTIAAAAKGYQSCSITVKSSDGAAVSRDITMELKPVGVSGPEGSVKTGTAYAVTVDPETVPEDADYYIEVDSQYFSLRGENGSWQLTPVNVYSGTKTVMAGYTIGNTAFVEAYELSCSKGQTAYPAAPALIGNDENVSSQSFTVPALPAVSSLTIRADGVAAAEQSFTGLRGGETLTLDFGSPLRGSVSYRFTYSSDEVEYTGSPTAAVSRSYYKAFTVADVILSAATLSYNGSPQSPAVSVSGLSAGEYTVVSGVRYPDFTGDLGSFVAQTDAVKPFEIYMEEMQSQGGFFFGMGYGVEVTGNADAFIRGRVILPYDIIPRSVTVTAADQEITYGGNIDTGLYSVSGLLSGHELKSSVSAAALEAPGGELTVGDVKITDGSGTDMARYYDVQKKPGTLTVKPFLLTVESVTAAKVYDGSAEGADSYYVKLSGWLGNDKGSATADIRFDSAEVGTHKSVTATNIVISDPNYAVAEEAVTGSGSISPRELSVGGIQAVDRIYNGSKTVELDLSGMTLDGLVAGEMPEVTASGIMSDAAVGSGKTVFLSIELQDSASCKLSNYKIGELQRGTTVNISADASTIILIADSAEKEYDGTALSAPGITLEIHGDLSYAPTEDALVYTLSNGHKLRAIPAPGCTITDPGTVANKIQSVVITDANGRDVTSYFSDIRFEDGTLEVKKNSAPITVTAGSGVKYYDGEALALPVPEVTLAAPLRITAAETKGNTTRFTLHTGDVLSVTVEGEITEPGSAENKITACAVYRGSEDVSAFYTLEESVNGTLTVEANPTPITIVAASAEKVYDAKPLRRLTAKLEIGEVETPEGYLSAVPITLEKYEVKDGKNYFTLSTGHVITFTMDEGCVITDVQRNSEDRVISVPNTGTCEISDIPAPLSVTDCFSAFTVEAGTLTVQPYSMRVVLNSARLNRLDSYEKTITAKESPAARNVSSNPACAYITVTLQDASGKKVLTALPGQEILTYTVERKLGEEEPNRVGRFPIYEIEAVNAGDFKLSNYDLRYIYGADYRIDYRFEDLFDDGGFSDQVVNTMGRCMWYRYMATPIDTRELKSREELLEDEEAFRIPLVAEEHYIIGETLFYEEDGHLMAELLFTGNPFREKSVPVDKETLKVHQVMFGLYRYMPSLYDVDKLNWKKVDMLDKDEEADEDSKDYVMAYDEELEAYRLVLDLGAIPAQNWIWVYVSPDAVVSQRLLTDSFRYEYQSEEVRYFWRWNG